jgi:hypothetical protein
MRFRQFLVETEFRFEGKSVGVITAHNPDGKPVSAGKNKKLNTELWNELRAAGYDPWPTKGKYKGHDEESFLIPNISRTDIIRLAAKYNQEAVLWARKADKGYAVEWIEGDKTIKRDKIASIRSLISQSVSF